MWGHCPVHGSQINTLAKLFKKYTSPVAVAKIPLGNDIIYEENNYRCYHKFPWVEATDKSFGEKQTVEGAIAKDNRMTIKYNGSFKPMIDNSVIEPMPNDLIVIDNGLWIIENDVRRVRIKSLINFAVVYLPLKKISGDKIL